MTAKTKPSFVTNSICVSNGGSSITVSESENRETIIISIFEVKGRSMDSPVAHIELTGDQFEALFNAKYSLVYKTGDTAE